MIIFLQEYSHTLLLFFLKFLHRSPLSTKGLNVNLWNERWACGSCFIISFTWRADSIKFPFCFFLFSFSVVKSRGWASAATGQVRKSVFFVCETAPLCERICPCVFRDEFLFSPLHSCSFTAQAYSFTQPNNLPGKSDLNSLTILLYGFLLVCSSLLTFSLQQLEIRKEVKTKASFSSHSFSLGLQRKLSTRLFSFLLCVWYLVHLFLSSLHIDILVGCGFYEAVWFPPTSFPLLETSSNSLTKFFLFISKGHHYGSTIRHIDCI